MSSADGTCKMIKRKMFSTEAKKMIEVKKFPTDGAQKMIILLSSDGKTFELEEAAALRSQILKNAIEDNYASIPIPNIANITSEVLETVVEYLRSPLKELELASSMFNYICGIDKSTFHKFLETTKDTESWLQEMMSPHFSGIEENIFGLQHHRFLETAYKGTESWVHEITFSRGFKSWDQRYSCRITLKTANKGTESWVSKGILHLKMFETLRYNIRDTLRDLFLVAHYLDIKSLTYLICRTLAQRNKDKTMEEICQNNDININDLTPEEIEAFSLSTGPHDCHA